MRAWLHNIGPIRDAKVDFAPLTVLVGPNGSGKTTLTNVVYAALLSHRAAVQEALLVGSNPFTREAQKLRGQALVQAMLERWAVAWVEHLDFELRRCCAPELHDLLRARRGGKLSGPRIGVHAGEWEVVFRLDRDELQIDHERTTLPSLTLVNDLSFEDARSAVTSALVGNLPRNAIYLPAGRSGIVHSQAALGRLMAHAISRGAFTDATIGAIPGATADLMQMLATIEPRQRRKRDEPSAARIERDLARGRLRLEVDGERRRVYFTPEGHAREWEVQNMATSVAELAPLVLYLRHGHHAGDALLIDEPEAHLHPNNQARLASHLVSLSRTVHPLVVATHSELLVSALSNEMVGLSRRLNGDSAPLRVYEFGFHDPDDRGLGVEVWQHQYEPGEGFAIEQFSAVADHIFEEGIERYNAGLE